MSHNLPPTIGRAWGSEVATEVISWLQTQLAELQKAPEILAFVARPKVNRFRNAKISKNRNSRPLLRMVYIDIVTNTTARFRRIVKERKRMKLGVTFPQNVIGGDAGLVRDFAQTVEGLGYSHIVAYDHVVGVDVAAYPDWQGPYTSADLFHDPFTLFSYIAAVTERIELSPQIVILPQRQAVLVAKQAASLDVLSGGRLRLGVGVGWNPVEYVALGEDFRTRGKRSEEQIAVMRALWAEPHVDFVGANHRIPNAGINPLPIQQPLPIWIGGGADVTYDRIGRIGDGWLNIYVSPNEAAVALAKIRTSAENAGRDPAAIGLDAWTGMAGKTPDQWRSEIATWRDLGATHITFNTIFNRGHLKAIEGRDAATHLAAMARYIEAVGDLFA
jgi:probable F420-dependent oxidoreductase